MDLLSMILRKMLKVASGKIMSRLGLGFLWVFSLVYFAPQGKAFDIEVHNLLIKQQSSTNEHRNDGVVVTADLLAAFSISELSQLYVRSAVTYNQKDQGVFPVGVNLGLRYAGRPFTRRMTPYLSGSVGFHQSTSTCQPQINQPISCIQRIVSSRIGIGLKAKFNPRLFMLLELSIMNAPLFGYITYQDNHSTTYYGFKLSTVTVASTSQLRLGFGIRLK
ncbi:MAG: hypothetical protein OXC40_05970 [Proteobacteria bacterium]|nr:hypothetical protein [Pseudomonadota bacterium]